LEVAQFVVRSEVGGIQARAALQADDFHASFGEFSGKNSARRAHAYDNGVSLLGGHGSALPFRSAGLGLQADQGRPREGIFRLHVRGVEDRLSAGEANQTPAREVFVAAINRVSEHAFDRVGADGVETSCAEGHANPFALPSSNAVIT